MKHPHAVLGDRPWRAGIVAGIVLAQTGCFGPERVALVGVVERKTIELAAPTSEVIVDTPISIGTLVKGGQVVVQLDNTVATAELKAHEAARAAAQAQVESAEREYNRVQGLRQAKVASSRQLDDARRQRDEGRALVAEKDARIAQATKRLQDLTIRSHEAGTLDQLPFEKGERVPAGGVVAVVLSSAAPWVRVWIPAPAVARVGPDSRAEVLIDGIEKVLIGHVKHVSLEPEYTPHYALTERESSHLVFETRVQLDESLANLRPGLAARVKIFLRPKGKK